MKDIRVKNKYIVQTMNFLSDMKLKGEQSRSRSKIVRQLITVSHDLKIQESELNLEYIQKDKNGTPVVNNAGNFKVIEGKESEYFTEHQKWENEESEFSLEEVHLKNFFSALETYDELLSNENAEIYDILYDNIEASLN